VLTLIVPSNLILAAILPLGWIQIYRYLLFQSIWFFFFLGCFALCLTCPCTIMSHSICSALSAFKPFIHFFLPFTIAPFFTLQSTSFNSSRRYQLGDSNALRYEVVARWVYSDTHVLGRASSSNTSRISCPSLLSWSIWTFLEQLFFVSFFVRCISLFFTSIGLYISV